MSEAADFRMWYEILVPFALLAVALVGVAYMRWEGKQLKARVLARRSENENRHPRTPAE